MTDALQTRSSFVRDRLLSLNKNAAQLVMENGALLREYKQRQYYVEEGYASFDMAIDDMHDRGMLDYRCRQARNFIAIVDMVDQLGIDPKEIPEIGMSKLREIATTRAPDTRHLLEAAKDMSVSEVQAEARKIRDKAAGRDTDPLKPWVVKTTESQMMFAEEAILEARRIYQLPEDCPEAAVLIDHVMAEWFTNKDTWESEQAEQSA